MKKTIIFLLTVCAASVVSAQTPYDEIVASVLRSNMGVKSELYAAEAEVVAGQAENSLGGPSVGFEHMWSSDPAKKDKWAVSVSQEFEYPGVYAARSKANALNMQALDYVKQDILSSKALSVKLMIIDIINAKARLAYFEELGVNLNSIGEHTKKSFDLGNATILDWRKMQLAIMNNERQIATCKADLASLISALEGMGVELNIDEEYWLSYPVQNLNEPSVNNEDYFEYNIMKLRSEASKATVKSIKRQAVPSFSLGYRHAFEDGTHFNGLAIGITLPSFSQNKRRKLAQLEAEALVAENTNEVSLAMAEQQGLYLSATSLNASISKYRRILGSESYLDLLKTAFEGGELTIIDYINEVNNFTANKLDLIDIEYRYNLTLAKLNRYRALEFN